MPPPGFCSLVCSCNSDKEMASPTNSIQTCAYATDPRRDQPTGHVSTPTHSQVVLTVEAEPSARCCLAGPRLRGAPPPTGAPARLGGPPGTSCRLGGGAHRGQGGRWPCQPSPGSPAWPTPSSLCAHRLLCARPCPIFTHPI